VHADCSLCAAILSVQKCNNGRQDSVEASGDVRHSSVVVDPESLIVVINNFIVEERARGGSALTEAVL
jgi:hypothetical protein